MSRARFYRSVQSLTGSLQTGVSVQLFTAGTVRSDGTGGTPLPVTVYTSDTGLNQLGNSFTAAAGVIDIYLALPQDIDLVLTYGVRTLVVSNQPVLPAAADIVTVADLAVAQATILSQAMVINAANAKMLKGSLLTSACLAYGSGWGSNASQVGPNGITYRASFITAVAGTDIRIYLPAWSYVGNDPETAPTQQINYTASLVYNGIAYAISFGSKRTIVVEPWGMAESSPLGLYLPAGVQVSLLINAWTATIGGQYPIGAPLQGPGVDVALDGFSPGYLADTATFDGATPNVGMWSPVAITCTPSVPVTHSWVGIGDGVLAGVIGDTGTPNSMGWFVRAVNNQVPAIRLAGAQDTAHQYALGYRVRTLSLACTSTHALVMLGSNDVLTRSGTQLQADLVAGVLIPLAARGTKTYVCTLLPSTTSIDGWATTTGQSPLPNENERLIFNEWVRQGLPLDPVTLAPAVPGTPIPLLAGSPGHPVIGTVETADAVESVRNSGTWITTGAADYATADGIHPSPAAAALIADTAALLITGAP